MRIENLIFVPNATCHAFEYGRFSNNWILWILLPFYHGATNMQTAKHFVVDSFYEEGYHIKEGNVNWRDSLFSDLVLNRIKLYQNAKERI